MKSIAHDARGFVEGVVSHLKKSDKGASVGLKVTSLLYKMSAQAKKKRSALVESAIRLSQEEQVQLAGILESVAGHRVSLDCEIKQELIGGLRVIMGDWVMDASIQSQLSEMAQLLEGGTA